MCSMYTYGTHVWNDAHNVHVNKKKYDNFQRREFGRFTTGRSFK